MSSTSRREERVREVEKTDDEVMVDCVMDDPLLYVKSLPLMVAVLHRSMSLYETPDLLAGLRKAYGTTAPRL
jgi:hypothetical protein